MKKPILSLLVTIGFVSSAVSQSQLSNGDYKFEEIIPVGLKSASTYAHSDFQIKNNTSRYLDFRWVDFQGNLDLVREKKDWGHVSIAPGNVFTQMSYVGHPWVITDPLNGKTFGYFVFLRPGTYKLAVSENDGKLGLNH
jgi:hypothetical protein